MRRRAQVFGADGLPYSSGPGFDRSGLPRAGVRSGSYPTITETAWLTMPALDQATLVDVNGRVVSSVQTGPYWDITINGGAASATLEAGVTLAWKLQSLDGQSWTWAQAMNFVLSMKQDPGQFFAVGDNAWAAAFVSEGTNLAVAKYMAGGFVAGAANYAASRWYQGVAVASSAGTGVTRPDSYVMAAWGLLAAAKIANFASVGMDSSGGYLDYQPYGNVPINPTAGNAIYVGLAVGRSSAAAGNVHARLRFGAQRQDMLPWVMP